MLLVKTEVLPEVFEKVVEAKRLLNCKKAKSATEAAKMCGISRSAFYKYRDAVFAYKEITTEIEDENEYFNEENDLIFVGLVGLKDPVRKNIKESIKACLDSHIRPIMLTGDNISTAYAIAKEVGICKEEKRRETKRNWWHKTH